MRPPSPGPARRRQRRPAPHYDDAIGPLTRASADADLFRLQQILFFRELGLGLAQIRQILERPDFDLVAELRAPLRTGGED